MQIASIMGAVAAGFFAMGTATIWPNLPPIDLRSIEYDPVNHVFSIDRKVRTMEPIYAPFNITFIDADNESRVKECDFSGTADFGPEEKEIQSWPIKNIIGQDCIDALNEGRSHIVIMSVSPMKGSPDVERSEVFTVQGE